MDGKGKMLTAEQAESEYRKQAIVQGAPLEGEAYDRQLAAWLGTYRKQTPADKRSIAATTVTFIVGICIVGAIAFAALILGGGLLAFILILIIGGIIACVPPLLVMMFTSTKKA